MPILQIWPRDQNERGVRFTIYAWGNAQHCELVDSLADLEINQSAESDKIWKLFQSSSDQGPPRNPQKCRPLEGKDADKLFEFKTSGGFRVAWFYAKNARIICTHAFGKCTAKELKGHINKAQGIRATSLEEQEHD
jgi:hypothetical protein